LQAAAGDWAFGSVRLCGAVGLFPPKSKVTARLLAELAPPPFASSAEPTTGAGAPPKVISDVAGAVSVGAVEGLLSPTAAGQAMACISHVNRLGMQLDSVCPGSASTCGSQVMLLTRIPAQWPLS